MLRGENFIIDFDGEKNLSGFFTTRFVKAKFPEDAELNAVDLVKNDRMLLGITYNIKGEEPMPIIYLEELSRVTWFTYFRKAPGSGYTFFNQKS
jgi:hypothetical protein